ncbi:GNAT family N-acetyltransferase [Kitasatospora sp. NPDC006697]|uniref:GNAT family N-acetyltransferase n=1 Tax=Kitasatospora sp. NPDC006697 TaxID=3364020 RepID=UPI0036BE13F8
MTDFTQLTDPADWLPAVRQRLCEAYQATGLPDAAATAYTDTILEKSGEWTATAVLDDGGRRVGLVATHLVERVGELAGWVRALWTDPALDGTGEHRRAALEWAERWCAERGAAQVKVRLAEPDPLFAAYRPTGSARIKPVGAAAEEPGVLGGVSWRPLSEAEYPAWLAHEQEAYAGDMLRSGGWTAEQARETSAQDFARLLPDGPATADNALIVMEAGGEVIGHGWLRHRHLPGVTFGYGLQVHPRFRGQGHGRAAMALGEQVVRAAGDEVLMLNVFGGNEVAMSLYSAVGYRVLEEYRALALEQPAEER